MKLPKVFVTIATLDGVFIFPKTLLKKTRIKPGDIVSVGINRNKLTVTPGDNESTKYKYTTFVLSNGSIYLKNPYWQGPLTLEVQYYPKHFTIKLIDLEMVNK